MSDLLVLDPVRTPDRLSIPAEDWQQTPTSVRQQFLSRLKRVEALQAHLPRAQHRPKHRAIQKMVDRVSEATQMQHHAKGGDDQGTGIVGLRPLTLVYVVLICKAWFWIKMLRLRGFYATIIDR